MDMRPSLKSILLGLAFLGIGNAFSNILVPIRAVFLKFDSVTIGFLVSLYYTGFLFGCVYMPKIVKRVGHIRAFILGAAVLGISTLGYSISDHWQFWLLFRFLSGSCIAGIYMLTESWVNEAAEDSNRGRTITVYRIVDLSAIVTGQLLIGIFSIENPQSFVIANIFMTFGLIPLALTTSPSPQPISGVKIKFGKTFRSSRIATFTSFVAGMAFGCFFGLGPVFAKTIGMDTHFIGTFVAMALLGGILFQLFVGKLADRYDREWLLVLMSFVSSLFSIALAYSGDQLHFLILLVGFWGGFATPIYSLAIAIANDRSRAIDFLEISGSLLLIYSAGAVVGPNIASIAMAQSGPSALFYFIASIFMILAIYIAVRKTVSRRPDINTEIENYVAVPKTSPSVFILDPRSEVEGHDSPKK